MVPAVSSLPAIRLVTLEFRSLSDTLEATPKPSKDTATPTETRVVSRLEALSAFTDRDDLSGSVPSSLLFSTLAVTTDFSLTFPTPTLRETVTPSFTSAAIAKPAATFVL